MNSHKFEGVLEGQQIRLIGKRHVERFGIFDYYSGQPKFCPKCNNPTESGIRTIVNPYELMDTDERGDRARFQEMELCECVACGYMYLVKDGMTSTYWHYYVDHSRFDHPIATDPQLVEVEKADTESTSVQEDSVLYILLIILTIITIMVLGYTL